MSLNKGKAKAKPSKKTTAKTAGTKKKAVMNRRKYNEAISGDTMSNYAMYRAGGKVKKYQAAGEKKDDKPGPVAKAVDDVLMAPGRAFAKGMLGIMNTSKDLGLKLKENLPSIKKGVKEGVKRGMKRLTDEDVRKPVGGYKKGGATKTKKFAALAPPYDKVTFADKIAGAKKRSKKK